jgi:hypothetical protein
MILVVTSGSVAIEETLATAWLTSFCGSGAVAVGIDGPYFPSPQGIIVHYRMALLTT